MRTVTVPKDREYLTDGVRLVQVLGIDDRSRLIAEDVSAPADVPGPIVRIGPGDLESWRTVIPQAVYNGGRGGRAYGKATIWQRLSAHCAT